MIEDERGVKGDPTRPGRRFMKRGTKGDASETGLVRFLTPVLMAEYGGPIECTSQLRSIRNSGMCPMIWKNVMLRDIFVMRRTNVDVRLSP